MVLSQEDEIRYTCNFGSQLVVIQYERRESDATIIGSDGSSKIHAGYSYNEASGNIASQAYVTAENDQHGYETTYDIDMQKGLTNSVTTPDGTEISYTYDADDNLLKTVSSGGTTVSYSYDASKTMLTGITHNGFDYGFVYDNFVRIKRERNHHSPLDPINKNYYTYGTANVP